MWRRGWDSNPRYPVKGTTVFETAQFQAGKPQKPDFLQAYQSFGAPSKTEITNSTEATTRSRPVAVLVTSPMWTLNWAR